MSEVKPRAVQLPIHIHEAEFKRNRYCVDVPSSAGPEDAVQPTFFANIASKLKAWDQVELRAEDGTWYMEVIVLDASRNWARVYPTLGPCRFTTADVSLTQAVSQESAAPAPVQQTAEDFELVHRQGKKWSVVRKADREVITEGHATKDAALAALTAHLKQRAGVAVSA